MGQRYLQRMKNISVNRKILSHYNYVSISDHLSQGFMGLAGTKCHLIHILEALQYIIQKAQQVVTIINAFYKYSRSFSFQCSWQDLLSSH